MNPNIIDLNISLILFIIVYGYIIVFCLL